MEITLSLSEVLNINRVLISIIDNSQTKVDALLKFRLLGIIKELEPLISNFDFIRNEKIMEYGEKTEDGNYQIQKDDKKAIDLFNHDLSEILNSDVTISINKLKSSDIFDRGIGAEYLVWLYPIIEE